MIRILHSVSNMQRAGLETMLMNYYRQMDPDKVAFDFLCNKPEPGEYEAEILQRGGRIYRAPGLNPLKLPQYMRFMAQVFAQSPDIRILHAHNESMAAYALFGAKRAGCPIRIFHSHNTATVRDYKYPLKMVCKSVLKYAYTDRWACSREAAKYYFGDQPAYILRNAIDLHRFAFSPEKRSALRRAFELENCYVIGHVGRFCVQKNQSFLLDAFAALAARDDQARLVMIGTGEQEDMIKGKIRELGLSERVRLTGSVSNTDEWYSALDVFALPSLYEGLPVVGVEAQAAGLPTLFADTITREAQALSATRYLPLTREAWLQALLDARAAGRAPDAAEQVRAMGYDINVEGPRLQERYLEMCGQPS